MLELAGFNGVNDPPIANNDTINIDEDETKTIQVSGTDLENDPLSFSITSLPSAGLLYQTNTRPCKLAILSLLWKVLLASERVLYCHLYTSPSPRDGLLSRMPSSA